MGGVEGCGGVWEGGGVVGIVFGDGSARRGWRDAPASKCRKSESDSRVVPSSAVGGTLGYACATCHRSFRRRQDIVRHKCVTTRPRGRVGHLSQT